MALTRQVLHRMMVVVVMFLVLTVSFAQLDRNTALTRLQSRLRNSNTATDNGGRPDSNPHYYRDNQQASSALANGGTLEDATSWHVDREAQPFAQKSNNAEEVGVDSMLKDVDRQQEEVPSREGRVIAAAQQQSGASLEQDHAEPLNFDDDDNTPENLYGAGRAALTRPGADEENNLGLDPDVVGEQEPGFDPDAVNAGGDDVADAIDAVDGAEGGEGPAPDGVRTDGGDHEEQPSQGGDNPNDFSEGGSKDVGEQQQPGEDGPEERVEEGPDHDKSPEPVDEGPGEDGPLGGVDGDAVDDGGDETEQQIDGEADAGGNDGEEEQPDGEDDAGDEDTSNNNEQDPDAYAKGEADGDGINDNGESGENEEDVGEGAGDDEDGDGNASESGDKPHKVTNEAAVEKGSDDAEPKVDSLAEEEEEEATANKDDNEEKSLSEAVKDNSPPAEDEVTQEQLKEEQEETGDDDDDSQKKKAATGDSKKKKETTGASTPKETDSPEIDEDVEALFSSRQCMGDIQLKEGKRTQHICHLAKLPTVGDLQFLFTIYKPPSQPSCTVVTGFNPNHEQECDGQTKRNIFRHQTCELGYMEPFGQIPDRIKCAFDDGTLPEQSILVYPPASRYNRRLHFGNMTVYQRSGKELLPIATRDMATFEMNALGGTLGAFQVDVDHDVELLICLDSLESKEVPEVEFSIGEDAGWRPKDAERCFSLDIEHEELLTPGRRTPVEVRLGAKVSNADKGITYTEDNEFVLEVNVSPVCDEDGDCDDDLVCVGSGVSAKCAEKKLNDENGDTSVSKDQD